MSRPRTPETPTDRRAESDRTRVRAVPKSPGQRVPGRATSSGTRARAEDRQVGQRPRTATRLQRIAATSSTTKRRADRTIADPRRSPADRARTIRERARQRLHRPHLRRLDHTNTEANSHLLGQRSHHSAPPPVEKLWALASGRVASLLATGVFIAHSLRSWLKNSSLRSRNPGSAACAPPCISHNPSCT